MLAAEEITYHIGACALNNRQSQKAIYSSFYNYSMTICSRYTDNQEDAVETVNEGFLKIFREIHHYKPSYADPISSFKGWLRKIMTHTAIDRYRKNRKHKAVTGLDKTVYQQPSVNIVGAEEIMSYKEIIRAIQDLSPAYRTVFNLFVIGGLRHEEIAYKLQISIGTSKSNLSKAKKQLQKILFNSNSLITQFS